MMSFDWQTRIPIQEFHVHQPHYSRPRGLELFGPTSSSSTRAENTTRETRVCRPGPDVCSDNRLTISSTRTSSSFPEYDAHLALVRGRRYIIVADLGAMKTAIVVICAEPGTGRITMTPRMRKSKRWSDCAPHGEADFGFVACYWTIFLHTLTISSTIMVGKIHVLAVRMGGRTITWKLRSHRHLQTGLLQTV